ncbi:hypothetical protein K7N18_10430 [Burkholderia arboris]|uniref:hypothetical protein n=1 Tax=Burkholderia arboris TaxID=488730 RepID=UPI001CA4136C|nr:hypothetical protein [Burkholderia arboris]MBY8605254.1 hypothetical protein [Burkholderia arboris]
MDEKGNEMLRGDARPAGVPDVETPTSSIYIEVRDGVLVKWIVNANADDCPDLLRNLALVGLEVMRTMRGA